MWSDMNTPNEIVGRVVESILAQKLAPGHRLGEVELAALFGVSRTLVREGLIQLQARGFVEVRPRKGWYVVEPSLADAKDAFAARRVIEGGLLDEVQRHALEGRPLQAVFRSLRQHIAEERQAIEDKDPAARSFVLADFHVCMADCLGHKTLCHVLRDLTARTTLAATLYQSQTEASQSCDEHEAIVSAMEMGDIALARQRMIDHIGHIEDELSSSPLSARDRLRTALTPLRQQGR